MEISKKQVVDIQKTTTTKECFDLRLTAEELRAIIFTSELNEKLISALGEITARREFGDLYDKFARVSPQWQEVISTKFTDNLKKACKDLGVLNGTI